MEYCHLIGQTSSKNGKWPTVIMYSVCMYISYVYNYVIMYYNNYYAYMYVLCNCYDNNTMENVILCSIYITNLHPVNENGLCMFPVVEKTKKVNT